MTINKLALFEGIKSLWPATIDLTKDPDGPHKVYWALERIVPVDDDWQQIAMWSFHQALDDLEKTTLKRGITTISPYAVSFADFDKRMRTNLEGDECWAAERLIWEGATEGEP